MRTAFVSGPISAQDPAQEAKNLRAFAEAARDLRVERTLREDVTRAPAAVLTLAWDRVYSPTQLPGTKEAAAESAAMLAAGEDYTRGPLYRRQIRMNVARLVESSVVFMLPGWRDSRGALAEAHVATMCGIEVRAWAPDGATRWLMTLHFPSLGGVIVGRWG